MSASLPRMKFDFPSISLPGKTFHCPHYVSPSHTGHICLFFYFQKNNPKLKRVCNDLSSQTKTMFFNPHYDFLSSTALQGQNISCSASLPFLPQPSFSCKCNHCLHKHSSTSLINLLQISQKQYQTKQCTCSLLALPFHLYTASVIGGILVFTSVCSKGNLSWF